LVVSANSPPSLLTVGEISKLLGVEKHRVEYVIVRRGIKAAARAGAALVYDEAAFERIKRELERIDAGREP
jgi:predicted transcriptional regulator